MELTDLLSATPVFDVKILLYGDSKIGKTTLIGSYTKGPIHFDFFDPNGPNALVKMVRDGMRKPEGISFEQFDHNDAGSFDKYWKHLQALEKSGLFKRFREENGIYCVDSYTALNYATMAKTMKTSKNDLPSQPDFRVNKGYIMNFLQTFTTLPCAAMLLCHTEISKDEATGSIKILPLVTGSMKTSSGVLFDDLLFMKLKGSDRVLCSKNSAKAAAGSRVIPEGEYKDFTMDDYFEYYATGKFSKKFAAS